MKMIISWILRILAAVIMGQTLFYKFTAHEDSVAIFSAIGMEPHGRIIIGVLELIAAILLLVPTTVAYGAILAWGLMSGAIMGHFSGIGFEGELLQLFLLGDVVWISSIVLLVMHKDQIPVIRHMFAKSERAPKQK